MKISSIFVAFLELYLSKTWTAKAGFLADVKIEGSNFKIEKSHGQLQFLKHFIF